MQPKLGFCDDGIYIANMVNQKKTLIIGIYAPNGAKGNYYKELIGKLDQVDYDQIMMFGDFIGAIDPPNRQIRKVKVKQSGKIAYDNFLINRT